MLAGAGADKVLSSDASGLASWQTPASSAPVSSVFGRTGNVTAASGDYSVGNITGAAPLASPTFTGTVTVPTPTVAGAAATKGYVDSASGGALTCTTATCTTGYACTATCPAGYTVTGGGVKGGGSAGVSHSYPSGNGWYCLSYMYGDDMDTCYAICCKIQ